MRKTYYHILATITCFITHCSEGWASTEELQLPHERTYAQQLKHISETFMSYSKIADQLTIKEISVLANFPHKQILENGKTLKKNSTLSAEAPQDSFRIPPAEPDQSIMLRKIKNTWFYVAQSKQIEKDKFPALNIENLINYLDICFGEQIYDMRHKDLHDLLQQHRLKKKFETGSSEDSQTSYKGILYITDISYGRLSSCVVDGKLSPNMTKESWCEEMVPYDYLCMALKCWENTTLIKGEPKKNDQTKTTITYYGYDTKLGRYLMIDAKRNKVDNEPIFEN